MNILLDTCGLLALQDGGEALSSGTRSRLNDPGTKVFVSAITAFEIGQKHAAGRIVVPGTVAGWFRSMLTQHHLEEIPLTSDICFHAASLPPIHKDPFDRLILATSVVHKFAILTSDRVIPTYPGTTVLW